MDTLTSRTYTEMPWWSIFAEGQFGRPPAREVALKREKLTAQITSRRSACSARVKRMRAQSERGIARLIREFSNGSMT
jgi:hypothetical protein